MGDHGTESHGSDFYRTAGLPAEFQQKGENNVETSFLHNYSDVPSWTDAFSPARMEAWNEDGLSEVTDQGGFSGIISDQLGLDLSIDTLYWVMNMLLAAKPRVDISAFAIL